MTKRIVAASDAGRRDLAVKADFVAIKADFAELEADLAVLEAKLAAAINEAPDGRTRRLSRIDYSLIGTLHDKIAPGSPPFDLQKFREQPHDPSLRD